MVRWSGSVAFGESGATGADDDLSLVPSDLLSISACTDTADAVDWSSVSGSVSAEGEFVFFGSML